MCTLQKLPWNRPFRCLNIPEDCNRPPSAAVSHRLDAVDAASDWYIPVCGETRLVCAENMGDITKLIATGPHLSFHETLDCELAVPEEFFASRDKRLDIEYLLIDWQVVKHSYQTATRQEERSESVPIPGLARTEGNGIV